MPNISDMFASVPGVKQDWIVDWKEDAKADWRVDWDANPSDEAVSAPEASALPTISGDVEVGEVLSVTSGTWTGNPAPTITYQWLVDDVEVDGATSSSYVIQAADAGLMVSVAVTGTNSEGSATEVVGVGPVNAAPANVDLPVISGTAQVGETLTVSDGTWTGFPAPSFSYAWFTSPDGTPGSWVSTGVTTADYTLQPADEAQFFFVQVTADNGVGSPVIAEAAAVGPVLPA
jgi:hypothetical protein